jgi:hypothetical protein
MPLFLLKLFHQVVGGFSGRYEQGGMGDIP